MTEKIRIGEFTVTALRDGSSHLPPSAYPGADFDEYEHLLDETGTVEIRIGAHLVQGPSGAYLIDAGAGELAMPFPDELAQANRLRNPPPFLARSGSLPESLAAAGVTPEDITAIFLTHLHLDHVGWLMKDGAPYFPGALAYYGAADWAELVDDVDGSDPARALMLSAAEAGILRTYEETGGGGLPAGFGVTSVPGHTPGHVMVTLSSGGESIWFVGDLIEHPGQLRDRNIHFMTDVDRDRATQERETLFARAREDQVVLAAAHLDNPTFRTITADLTWRDATL